MSLRPLLKAVLPALAVAAMGLASTVPARAAGDPVNGQKLAYTCKGCHAIETYKNVYPTFSVPKLRGQHAEYLGLALKAYRSGERSHGTMHAHATSLSDQDIEDIATFLSGETVQPDTSATPKGTPPAAVATCQACHGPVGVGIVPMYPTLSGQHADYLAHALESYRNGSRKNGIMQPFAAQLSPADIAAVAKFYSQQKPALKTLPMKDK